MNVERTASHSMIDASEATVVPNRVRPSIKTHFAPIAEYENCMFAALKAKENLAEAHSAVTGRQARLPRFSLLRGEVALMAERVFNISRGAA